jgi:hypothetical protein
LCSFFKLNQKYKDITTNYIHLQVSSRLLCTMTWNTNDSTTGYPTIIHYIWLQYFTTLTLINNCTGYFYTLLVILAVLWRKQPFGDNKLLQINIWLTLQFITIFVNCNLIYFWSTLPTLALTHKSGALGNAPFLTLTSNTCYFLNCILEY